MRETSASVRSQVKKLQWRAQWIGALLLLATLPLAIASVILPKRVQSTLTQLSETYLTRVADDLATFVQKAMALHLERLVSISAQAELHEAVDRHNVGLLDKSSLERINRQLWETIRHADTEVQGIFMAGQDGIVFAGTLQNGETEPYQSLDVRDRAYFQDARQSLRPVVSDPIRSKIADVPVVAICVPFLNSEGRFDGFIAVSIKLKYLNSQIVGRRIGETGYPYAVDRNGILVAHPDQARFFGDSLVKQANATKLVARMLAGERGIERYVASTRENKIAAFTPVPICRWSVAASMEVSEFQAPANQLRQIIFAMIGACVLIALLLGVAFVVGYERLRLALTEAQASEARFRLLANVAGSAIWDWDLGTNEVWWSDGLRSAFGWLPEEVPSYERLCGLIRHEDRPAFAVGMDRCLKDGRWVGEHGFIRQDGTTAYVLNQASLVRDADGRAQRLVGGITDISARREAEEKNAEQAALLDQTRDGIVVFGLDGDVHYWNSGAAAIYGWSAEEVLHQRKEEIFGVDPAEFAAAQASVLANGQWTGRLRKKAKAGQILTVDCRQTLMRDGNGQPKSILSIETDISERLLTEAKFLRAQRLESIGTLAGGIAHDLNNMLSPVLIGMGLLRLSPLPEGDARLIGNIEQSALRGAQLVKQLLSFARGLEGARVPVHAGYVIREVDEMVRSTFPKDIQIRCDIARDLRLVMADPTQLNQVFLNLCVNARDAMPAGGLLTIAARNIDLDHTAVAQIHNISPGPHIVVEVADTGTGMPPAVIEKIFDPFYTTKAPGKGTGLGLATVLGIVRSHAGTISVYSEEGKGSVFKIYLPETVGVAPAGNATPAAAPLVGRGELILLVDDEASILSAGKLALESMGYSVLIATDGAHAFTLYHRHRSTIALIITDMMMPIMDGIALVAAIRRIDPDIRVVGSSGLHDHHNQFKASELGIRHFLLKPYTTGTLQQIVGEALRGATASRLGRPAGV